MDVQKSDVVTCWDQSRTDDPQSGVQLWYPVTDDVEFRRRTVSGAATGNKWQHRVSHPESMGSYGRLINVVYGWALTRNKGFQEGCILG